MCFYKEEAKKSPRDIKWVGGPAALIPVLMHAKGKKRNCEMAEEVNEDFYS